MKTKILARNPCRRRRTRADPNSRGNYEGSFTLVAGPDTGNGASTKFLRPEDGAWDKIDIDRYFFVTIDTMDAAKDGNLNTDIPANQVGRHVCGPSTSRTPHSLSSAAPSKCCLTAP